MTKYLCSYTKCAMNTKMKIFYKQWMGKLTVISFVLIFKTQGQSLKKGCLT